MNKVVLENQAQGSPSSGGRMKAVVRVPWSSQHRYRRRTTMMSAGGGLRWLRCWPGFIVDKPLKIPSSTQRLSCYFLSVKAGMTKELAARRRMRMRLVWMRSQAGRKSKEKISCGDAPGFLQ